MEITDILKIGLGVFVVFSLIYINIQIFTSNKVYDNEVLRDKGYTFRCNLYSTDDESKLGAKSIWYDEKGTIYYGNQYE